LPINVNFKYIKYFVIMSILNKYYIIIRKIVVLLHHDLIIFIK